MIDTENSASPAGLQRAVRSRRVVTPEGIAPAVIWIADGRIERVAAYDDEPPGGAWLDAGEAIVMPGAVDSHVHIDDPGRADWEGFPSATRAAAAGGVTTLVDMPLNSIPATTHVDALRAKRDAAHGRCHVDVGFWGGLVPGNAGQLAPLWREGVLGFKAFLVPSGVPEFEAAGDAELAEAGPLLSELGAPLLVHAEWPAELRPHAGDPRSYANYLASRPPSAETAAISQLIAWSRATGARLHIVHVATRAALPLLRAAREEGLPVSSETCPHYLTFAAEEIADGATAWKCAPPIRSTADREALWQALGDGVLQAVVSDHSPSPPALKLTERGDFVAAWGGIASLQLSLSAVWTAAQARGYGVREVARWMSSAPAELAGLSERKGAIAPGRDADLVILDPDARFTVTGARLEHRHPLTPYEGLELRGVVRQTLLRGSVIYDRGAFAAPSGTLLTR